MGKPFASAYQRIKWAQEHIIDLKKRSRRFFASHEYRRIGEFNPKSSETIDKIRLIGPMPDAFTRLTVQTIENLRSALDHAACAVVLNAAAKKRTLFPFGDTEREFKAALQSKCKHVPAEIKSLFGWFQPYKRGNSALWALNKLCNTHKHRTIIEPGINVKEIRIAADPTANSMLFSQPVWNRRKNEIIVSRAPGEGTIHHDVDATLGIAFGKVPVFGGRPALAGLRYLTDMVKHIVRVTEGEARRIGVIK